jgi:hypothetical protein
MRRWLLTLKGDVGLGLEGVLRAPSDFVSVFWTSAADKRARLRVFCSVRARGEHNELQEGRVCLSRAIMCSSRLNIVG